MSYQALARKWRPQTFGDIIGQETAVRTLQNAIEQNRIHHAFLFSGVRGIGKTTTARIFAKALNCTSGPAKEPCNDCTICREITEGIDLDVREIDAATYTQVDNIRELREVTQFQPARDRNRIFIIDEAHMLSAGAWNALLKLIEEPPPHVVFMMATTEMHKVPATILSRVQQFVLRKVSQGDLVARMAHICTAEAIDAEPEALEIVARRAEGSVRDALSILDQIVAFGGRRITTAHVVDILGLSDSSFFSELVSHIHDGDQAAILDAVDRAAETGRDFKLLFRDFLGYLRNLLLLASGASERLIAVDADELSRMRAAAERFETSELLRILNLLLKDDEIVTRSEQQRLAVEIALLKCAMFPRLRAVEDVLGGGTAPAPPRRKAPMAKSAPLPDVREMPAGETAAPPWPAADLAGKVVARVAQEKKVAGSYLRQAKSAMVDGAVLVFEFNPADAMAIDYLSDDQQRAQIERIASELGGRPLTIELRSAGKGEAAQPAASSSPLQSDPLVQAFARHLGGEVVLPRKPRA